LSELLELRKINNSCFKSKNSVVVIGFFDGVHLGHKKIIEVCVKRAKKISGTSIVLTFNKPPLNVIKSETYKKLIISYDEKIKIIESLGVDFIVTANFDSGFFTLKPAQFCEDILNKKFHVREIFVGSGFCFGFKAEGDVYFLKRFFKPYNIKVNEVTILKINGEAVSSTNTRKYYSEGKIKKIKNLLGRNPQIEGVVVRGAGRGRRLGFPTANIDVYEDFIAPKDGVYLGTVEINGNKNKEFPAIINIGDKPTFEESKKWIEAFIINFRDNIYKRKIRINFLERLRDEIAFESEDKLISQMKMDLEYAKRYFKIKS